jgi:all-trans-retinol dehydrogenase (NAD+)
MAIIDENVRRSIGVLTAPLRLLMSDPRITGPVLLALLYYPSKVAQIVPARLLPYLTSPSFIRALKVCLGWSVLSRLNTKLSDIQVNNWKGSAKFVPSQELVLISGGSSGIGRLMALGFAERGVKVVIVDLNAPRESLRKLWVWGVGSLEGNADGNAAAGVTFYEMDVTSTEKIAEIGKVIKANHGSPTVLVSGDVSS